MDTKMKKGHTLAFWSLLEKGGHRVFTERDSHDMTTGRYAIADESGSTPQTTDNGVLWIDREAGLTMWKPFGNHLPVAMKVWSERDGDSYTVTTGGDGALMLLRTGILKTIRADTFAPEWIKLTAAAFQAQAK